MTTRTWWILIRVPFDGRMAPAHVSIQSLEAEAIRIRDTLNGLGIHTYVVIPVKEEELECS